MSSIKIDVIIERQLFYNDDSNFGIYGCRPKDATLVKLNMYGGISIKGVIPKLEVGSTYTAEVIEKNDPKYGIGYEVQSIYQDVPQTINQQRDYLSAIISPYLVDAIFEVYKDQDVIQMFRDGTLDHTKVYGMGEVTYEKTREKVLGNLELQEALVELSKFGLNYNHISKMVKHYGSAKLVVQRVNENPYILTEIDGFGFKTVDGYALKMGVEKTSKFRIDACLKYILKEEANSSGHCWLSQTKLVTEALDYLQISKKLVNQYINEYNGKELHIEDDRVALISYYLYDKWIYEHIIRLLSAESSIKMEKEELEKRILEAQEKQGFEFTDEQRQAIEYAANENVMVLNGKAGTGKTSVLKGVLNVLSGNRYETCALSGKAAQRIQESTGFISKTIHRMLGWSGEGFGHSKDNPLDADIIVLDEASMVNNYIAYSLISAVKNGAKLIILGDTEQLEPIGASNVLKDLIDSNAIPRVTLTKVHRQAMRSGILSTANLVRDGIQFAEKDDYSNRVIGELKDLFFKPYKKSEAVFNKIIDVCENYAESGKNVMDFQVIVPLKKRGDISTQNLNMELQNIFNPELKPTLKRNNIEFKEGDKIIQCGNNYEAGGVGVFNGTIGIIKYVDAEQKRVGINFSGIDQIIEYTQEEMSQIDLAYALTVHRVQGSQFDHVLFAVDYSAYKLLSRQIIYTALTRSAKSCTLICELDALLHAVRTDKSSKRNTFLLDFLTTSAIDNAS